MSTAVKHTSNYTHTFRALNTLRSCTAEGDSFQLCPCRSLYLPEYGLTMVMGMNGCGAFSLTSCGLIIALEQARTLTHSQSDSQTYTTPERMGEISVLGVWVGYVFACAKCLCFASLSTPYCISHQQQSCRHVCLLITELPSRKISGI